MSVKIGNIDLGEFPLLLAPMEDVSDPPFRALCKRHGSLGLWKSRLEEEIFLIKYTEVYPSTNVKR